MSAKDLMGECVAALEIALKAQDDLDPGDSYEFRRGFMFGFCAARGASSSEDAPSSSESTPVPHEEKS